MNKLRPCVTLAAVVSLICTAAPSRAQSMSDVLQFLVTNQSIATGSVARDQAAAQAASDAISRALLTSLATLPVSTSSGAFVYKLNPELGTVERASQTFGPFFVERALTAGKGNASVALTFQHLRFNALDGQSLRNGTLITTANQFVDESQPFDVDRLTLNIDADVATLYGSVGITDRLEVGAALPMVSLRMNGSRIDTYRLREFTQATASARTIGPADAVVRGKYTLYNEEGMALAAAVDVRLPSGKQTNLLGTGSAAAKMSAIGSLESGRLSSHVSAGYSVGGLSREITYGGAVVVAAAPRVSLAAEVFGQWIQDGGRLTTITQPHPTLVGVQTLRLASNSSSLNAVTVAPGLKWNLLDTWVLVGNVTIPVTDAGLTTKFTPFVGLEYTRGR